MAQSALPGNGGLGVAAASQYRDLGLGAGGVSVAYGDSIVVGVGYRFGLAGVTAAAGIGDGITAAGAAVPVVAQGLQLFLGHFAADGAFQLAVARSLAAGGDLVVR